MNARSVRSAGLEPIKSALIEANNNDTAPDADQKPPPMADLARRAFTRKSSEASEKSREPLDRIQSKNGLQSRFEKQLSLQDLFARNTITEESNVPAFQRGRSNSDGAAIFLVDDTEAFPSLPNAVLERLGLYGDVPRERLNEESLEQKFTSLSLAFTIDSTTIKDRCERQRRGRDQTENNFNQEVEKLTAKLALLKPLCIDFETADLLSTLFSQVETLTKAASLVSIAAERYGAVQHEERLTESVQLMVSHVQALKQQRDSARRQLQYTKRVLQEPVQPSVQNSTNQKTLSSLNKKLIGQRRASAESMNLNSQQPDQNFKQLNRRISDLSFRASLAKSRPSRLDLGMELNKIKEMSLDEGIRDEKHLELPHKDITREDYDSDIELFEKVVTPLSNQVQCDEHIFSEISNFVRLKLSTYVEHLHGKLLDIFKKWSGNGYLHVFLTSCAVLCFSVSVLTLASIFLEQEYAKIPTLWLFPWVNRKN